MSGAVGIPVIHGREDVNDHGYHGVGSISARAGCSLRLSLTHCVDDADGRLTEGALRRQRPRPPSDAVVVARHPVRAGPAAHSARPRSSPRVSGRRLRVAGGLGSVMCQRLT